jgi:phosphoribosyl 1,2-cyclic phosphodiesterase
MPTLFHHDVAVAVLGSGSRGNCVYVGDGRRGVLVDCGLSARQVFERLDAVGLADAPIDAVLVTHEHADHVGAAAVLDRALSRREGRPVPYYMTAGTERGLHERCRPSRVERVRAGQPVRFGGFTLEPYTIPHDTSDPVAWTIEIGSVRVGVLTDLGSTNPLVTRQFASLDVAVLEFNHDVRMLMEGAYPWPLKQRVRGRHGHLSNDQAADLVAEGAASGRLAHLVLAHLSEENNTPELAYRAAEEALWRAGRRDVGIEVGRQREALPTHQIRAPLELPAPSRARLRRVGERRADRDVEDRLDRQQQLFGG